MNKTMKSGFLIAISLILIGLVFFVVTMTAVKWDFSTLSTVKYELNLYEINQDFQNISISTDTADIKIVYSTDSKCVVECYQQTKVRHLVELNNGTLKVSAVDKRRWFDHFGINFGSPEITVSLPKKEFGNLSIQSNTGKVEIAKDFKFNAIDISEKTGMVKNCASAVEQIKISTTTGGVYLEEISSGSIDISVSTGNVTLSKVSSFGDVKINLSTGKTNLTNLSCKNLNSTGSTGDVILSNVVSVDKFFIKRSTGDVHFDGCDATEIYIETDTGDVSGSFLTEKIFFAKTDTGRISLPNTTQGGKCEIITDTGDITVNVLN